MPIIALATLKVVLLQLNGMLIMWKIQRAMQDNTIRTIRIHPAFILVTGLTVISVWQLSQPRLSCEHIENLHRIRRGQPGQLGLL